MPPRDPGHAVRLSVLDRLLGEDGPPAGGTPWSRSVARHRASLLRDLEALLNTRRTIEPAPPELAQVRASVHHYGLPDLGSFSAADGQTREELAREVELAIQRFEPRLSRVRVTPAGDGGPHLRFVVEGLLRMDPEPERVAIDTVLEVASGTFQVREDGDA